jgi:hypothetical protein
MKNDLPSTIVYGSMKPNTGSKGDNATRNMFGRIAQTDPTKMCGAGASVRPKYGRIPPPQEKEPGKGQPIQF